jgi:prefoldin alpha subunit
VRSSPTPDSWLSSDWRSTPDNTILVPLTNSLYVPGKLSDLENVIVDVGTGYYVKKVRSSHQIPRS